MSTTQRQGALVTTVLKLRTAASRATITTQFVISLKAEKIVCLPSDTCYGLSCIATSQKATAKLGQIKSRSASKPFILIANDVQMARHYVRAWSPEAQAIARAFWPGPITIIVPFRQHQAFPIAHTSDTIAIRVPESAILREIIRKVGWPLWSTSANDPGGPCAATISNVPVHLQKHIDLMLDVGKLPGRKPSTVIDLSRTTPTILREGPIKAKDVISKTNIPLLNDNVDR